MIFEFTQPKGKNDIKCNRDCMVRAVTNITKEEYSKVHKIMYGYGWRATRDSSKGKWQEQITKTLNDLGFKHKKISFPAIEGQNRMTGKELSKLNPNSKYIIRVAKHVSVLDCGKLLDTWDCSDSCIYFAWEIIK